MCARLKLETKAEVRPTTRPALGVLALLQTLPATRLEAELELRLVEALEPTEEATEECEEEPDLDDWHEDPDGDTSQPDDEQACEFDSPNSALQELSQRVDVLVDIGPEGQLLLTSGLSPLLLRLATGSGLARQFHLGLRSRIEDSLKLAQVVVETNPNFFRQPGKSIEKIDPDQLSGFSAQRLSALLKTLTLRTPWGEVVSLGACVGRRSAAPDRDLELLQWLLEHLEEEREYGVVPEAELAKQLGITPQALGQRRKALGIPSALQRKKHYLVHPEDDALLASWVTSHNAKDLRTRLAQLLPQLHNKGVLQLARCWKAEADRRD